MLVSSSQEEYRTNIDLRIIYVEKFIVIKPKTVNTDLERVYILF